MIKKTSRILWRKRIVEVFLIMATEIIFVFVSHLFQLDGMDSVLMLLKKLVSEYRRFRCSPDGSDGKESACNVGDLGLIPGWGRSPGGGHSNPLQYSCLEDSMDRGAWWATVHGVTKSQIGLSG